MSRAGGSNSSCVISPLSSTFANYVAAQPAVAGTPGGYPGSFERVDIVPTRTSYPRAATRSDCAGTSCTYDEEMTNFANWWSYYHTRLQSMKSAATRAFASVGDNRRVAYLSINNNTGSDFLNFDTFSGAQKTSWFSKLTHAKPNNSTPLRTALATAGRLYAGKLNGSSLNGSSVVDPMLYSCQRNFTILSTDGFWNESSNPKQLDGSTDIGDQDGALARPKLDGRSTANTLSDVAAYYRNTDLRIGVTGSAACTNASTGQDVCGNGDPQNAAQYMKTFTLGLGASGYMQFRPDYLSATSGDYFAVKEGATPNAASGVCTWQASGSCNWPAPISNTLTTIDDLWHAAVNGDGTYFSASDPTTLYTGLSSALAAIDVQTKAAAAATTSNPNVSAGDNQVFVSNFNSGEWSGDLQSQRIDTVTGIVNGSTADWSARALLDTKPGRTIYMFSGGAPDKLKPFDWVSLSAAEKSYFSLSYVTTPGQALSQFCSFGVYCVSASDQAIAAGAPLVDFLRGDRSNEGPVSVPARYFRERAFVLGDIVSSEAVYVKQASFAYTDGGYSAFKTAVANRQGMVYVGANDGMLHAFDSSTGQELWAYIPTLMLPKLYRLADKEYATRHEYFVDGTPAVQDVFIGGAWRTLLVGGLGAGGRGYYALDITDPAAPKALWEFTDSNLGLTMGKPEIGKLRDGRWAVFFASGYNNVSPGDGHGRLFVVNAADGSLIRSIDTGAGSTATPSGLAHIRAWVDDGDVDNTVQRVYGGDNLGNLWRFDVNDIVGAPGYDAQRLATLMSPAGVAQPVTSRPELGLVGDIAMVFVGTGRYLGQSDLSDANVQSIYAVKDRLDTQDFGDPRAAANRFVKQTISAGTCPANTAVCTSSDVVRVNSNPQPVDLAVDGGWYVDLPETRERVNTDPQLALGTLVVNSNVIETGNVCKVGGSSYANFLDYRSGAPVSTANGVTSVALGNAISTRPALIKLPNNKVISVSRLSDNRTISTLTPVELAVGNTRRLSWRDLIQN
jgi:type IV pilus assembly protein PilY1